MSRVLPALPLSYAVLSEGHRDGGAPAVHEPSPAGRPYRPRRQRPQHPPPAPRRPGARSTLRPAGVAARPWSASWQKRDWEPPRPRFEHHQIVGLQVAFAEVAARDRVKHAGGTNPERRVRQLRNDRVIELGLNRRRVDAPASTGGCSRSSGEHLQADTQTRSRTLASTLGCWHPMVAGGRASHLKQ
jgi:hypothetical protein